MKRNDITVSTVCSAVSPGRSTRRMICFFTMALCITLFFLPKAAGGTGSGQPVPHPASVIISELLSPRSPPTGYAPFYTIEFLKRFYSGRDYRPAWIQGPADAGAAATVIAEIERASDAGLRADFYHLARIRALHEMLGTYSSEKPADPRLIAEMDMLMTDAVFMLGCHYARGCVDPLTKRPQWKSDSGSESMYPLLAASLEDRTAAATLRRLLTQHRGYERLQAAYAHYRQIAAQSGWPSVSSGRTLREGDEGERVAELRRRLVVTGDLSAGPADNELLFDDRVHDAVTMFQRRHGLDEDGAVGPMTRRMMNVTVEERLRQIEVNLERLRWIPDDTGSRSLTVNIAAFELEFLEEGEQALSMKVIVGKPYMDTPVFRAVMTHIVLNPSWYVPDGIAVREILPKVRDDAGHLTAKGFRVYRKGKGYRHPEDIASINWAEMGSESFPYIFVQPPGPENPLGNIKFVFQNRFNVYLHDTPARELFERSRRAFSHGCIRIEKAYELAERLLRGEPGWSRGRIDAVIESGKEIKVPLTTPVTVHVQYLTAWVGTDDIVHFRSDLYGRDRQLGSALRTDPAAVAPGSLR